MKTAITPARGRFFSIRDAAKHLGMSEGKVKKLITTREIAAVFHPSGRISGVYEADADAWVARRRQPAQVAPDRPAPRTTNSVDRHFAQLDGADTFR